jgi:3-isopropylmalate dehydrogenase
MMLRQSFGMTDAATAIESAVQHAIESGLRTGDIFSAHETGARKVGTREMGDAIAAVV